MILNENFKANARRNFVSALPEERTFLAVLNPLLDHCASKVPPISLSLLPDS